MTTKTSEKPPVAYDCTRCVAYCCSIYERVEVTQGDLRRLARHFRLTLQAAEARFTKRYAKERILRRRKDSILGRACMFLDEDTRGCTIYEARPQVCRDYPGRTRCGYYDVLQFERKTQEDPTVVPLVQITFLHRKRGG